MAKKRTTLPKDFEALLEKGDLNALKAVFDKCDVNERGGYNQQTALAWPECPDELARWLVENGADLAAEDKYGEPPLTLRAWHWKGGVEILLELGADIHHGEGGRGTALHAAASHFRVACARTLLKAGARIDARDDDDLTPLERALQACKNANIADMAAMAELLLESGAPTTPQMIEHVKRIGKDFEFHRANFSKEMLADTDAGLARLYEIFGAAPIAARRTHDGVESIIATSATMDDRHQELWEWLVPSSGAAATVQGEVIRVSGRLHSELYHNGGANWDRDFKTMADALLDYLSAGTPLHKHMLSEARSLIAEIKRTDGTARLCELAVDWVALNPQPIKLSPPKYKR